MSNVIALPALTDRCTCGHLRRAHPAGGTCLAAITAGSVCPCPLYQPASQDQKAA